MDEEKRRLDSVLKLLKAEHNSLVTDCFKNSCKYKGYTFEETEESISCRLPDEEKLSELVGLVEKAMGEIEEFHWVVELVPTIEYAEELKKKKEEIMKDPQKRATFEAQKKLLGDAFFSNKD